MSRSYRSYPLHPLPSNHRKFKKIHTSALRPAPPWFLHASLYLYHASCRPSSPPLPRPHRRARNAAACYTTLECHRLLSYLPTTTHHLLPSSSSQRNVVHGNCSGAIVYLYVAKVNLDVACVCNGFRVFSDVFATVLDYVASVSTVSDVCCKCFL